METVHEIIRQAETNYLNGTAKIGKYVDFSMHNTVETIIAYLNSKFTGSGGDKDSLGREKPFFNIVIASANIWFRATDIDRKDISIAPSGISQVAGAFLATIHLQEWMKKARFGTFLNEWGRVLARFGSAVVEFIERDDELICSVIPWNKLIVDPQDFSALPVIKKLYFTPAQLKRKKEYDQDIVQELLDARVSRRNIDRTNQDTLNNFIEVFEVHGELSQAVYNQSKGKDIKKGDEDIYFQQVHIVSYVGTGKRDRNNKEKYEDFTLYSGKEDKPRHMLTHLIEEDGRTLSIGAVEHLFDAQWMQNHTMKNIKDTLDIASLLVFQTADQQFVGRNLLNQLVAGDVMVWDKKGSELTQVNTSKYDITALQNFGQAWKNLGNEINGISESMLGENPPSGTAWRQTEALLQESHSLFELMIENKALALEEMLRVFIIPFLKKKLNNKNEIAATLEDHNLKKVDAMYIPNAAIKAYNRRAIEDILNGVQPSPFNQSMEEGAINQELSKLGGLRSFKPTVEINGKEVEVEWKKVFKDLEWKLDINISGESKNKRATLETLSTTFQTIVSLAGRPMSPDERLVFNKLMSQADVVSPLELSTTASAAMTGEFPAMAGGRTPIKKLEVK